LSGISIYNADSETQLLPYLTYAAIDKHAYACEQSSYVSVSQVDPLST